MTSPNTGSSPSPAEERSAANMSTIKHGNCIESEVVNADTQVGSKRKRRYVVWIDFVEVIVDRKLKDECVFCHKEELIVLGIASLQIVFFSMLVCNGY